MTTAEHVQWARRRAHEYVDAGHGQEAINSLISDLGKHDTTAPAALGCWVAAIAVDPNSADQLRRWIDGCMPVVPLEGQ